MAGSGRRVELIAFVAGAVGAAVLLKYVYRSMFSYIDRLIRACLC